jgi:hypothetical protein
MLVVICEVVDLFRDNSFQPWGKSGKERGPEEAEEAEEAAPGSAREVVYGMLLWFVESSGFPNISPALFSTLSLDIAPLNPGGKEGKAGGSMVK